MCLFLRGSADDQSGQTTERRHFQHLPALRFNRQELIRTAGSDGGSSLVDICLHGTQREISAVPLRLRLIALGFVKGLSPEEVNRRLLENGCPRLYARSYWEASVIFALRKGLTYARWKEMLVQCGELREKIVSNNRAFSDGTISLSDIRLYVGNNSLR